MSLFSELFGKKDEEKVEPVLVDMHSHLLPGLDDGSQSLEESMEMIQAFSALGYKKLITTPHVMGDFYKNSPDIINLKLDELRKEVERRGIDIQLEAAAEYYLDETFLNNIKSNNKMLSFGENYLLFETSYLNEPSHLLEIIFEIKSNGYWPVLAHPERYQYLCADFSKFEELYAIGISFQMNINSISGYYNKTAEIAATKLIKNGMVNFIGSDCHSMKHIDALRKSRATKEYNKVLALPLLNNSLLG